jgi:hypothetical protein
MRRLSTTIFLIAVLTLTLSIVGAQEEDFLSQNNVDDYVTGSFTQSLTSIVFGDGTLEVAGSSHFTVFTTASQGFSTGLYPQSDLILDWGSAEGLIEQDIQVNAVLNLEIWSGDDVTYYAVDLVLSNPDGDAGMATFTAAVNGVAEMTADGITNYAEGEFDKLGNLEEFDAAALFILVNGELAEYLQDGRSERLKDTRLGGGSSCLVNCG